VNKSVYYWAPIYETQHVLEAFKISILMIQVTYESFDVMDALGPKFTPGPVHTSLCNITDEDEV